MKRLLSLLVMLVSFTCLWAQDVTDVITLQSYKDAGYTCNPSSWTTDARVTGESGAEYWASEMDYLADGLNFYAIMEVVGVSESVGLVTSVEMVGTTGVYEVYASHEPITKSNVANATHQGTINGTGKVDVQGDFEYAAIQVASNPQAEFTSLSFTWKIEEQGGGEDPEPPVVSGGSDAITQQMFRDAGYTKNYANPGNVTAESGAEYTATDIDFKDGGLLSLHNIGEMISVTKSVGMVASVSVDGTWGNFEVYVSHDPITKDNYASATFAGKISEAGTVTVDGDYEYAAVRLNSGGNSFTSVTFNWKGGETTPGLVDHITPANLKAQNPDGNFSASGYMDQANSNAELNYKGESGADYYLSQVISDGTTFWANDWSSTKGQCYNTSAPGYIKGIKFSFSGWVPSNIIFYVSANPITNENKYDAKQIILEKNNGQIPEWVADEVCKYFYLDTAQESYSDVCVTWTTEAPLIPVKTPEINCGANPVTPGSTVYVSTETQNATLHLSVYVNDVLDAELSKDVESSSTSFELPGKAGDEVRVEVYATADELVQSETATATYTLEMPLAATPQLEGGWLSYVVPGQQVTFYSETEGAQITYKMSVSDWNNAENNWEGEEVTAPSPVTVTVPEQAKPGTTFILTATAIAEGYQQSNGMEEYINAISPKLEIPTFSLEDGTEVRAGTQVQVYRPSYATGIRYTINGGEVQTCEDWALTYDINEDVTITAWVYGPEPLEESDKVTCSYKLEKFEAWHDVIIPENFTDNFSDTTMKLNECTSDNTNIDYKYYGGFWPSEGSNCFYMQCRYSYQNGSIIYNTTPGQINRIKVDGASNWSSVYILFSDEAPITEVTDAMADYDYAGPRLRVGGNGETVAAYGEWIDLKALDTVGGLDLSKAKYFAIYAFGQNVYVNRVVVEYDPAMFSSTINLSEKCTDGTNYYGTYSSTKPFVVADDITVSEISVADNKLVVTDYAPGAVVPANTGVMVSSTTSGDHKVVFAKEEGTSVLGEDNMLRPTGDAGITAAEMADKDADCKYYRLTMHKGETLGYFYGAANGAAFDVAAHKAYLAVPAAVAAKVLGFVLDGGNVTGIDSVTDDNQSDGTHAVYNLQGQRVNGKLVKGVYIVNGKKMIIK